MTVALKNSLNQKKGNYLHFYQQIRKSESLYNTVNALKKGISKKAGDFLKIIGRELTGYLTGSGSNNIVSMVLVSTNEL